MLWSCSVVTLCSVSEPVCVPRAANFTSNAHVVALAIVSRLGDRSGERALELGHCTCPDQRGRQLRPSVATLLRAVPTRSPGRHSRATGVGKAVGAFRWIEFPKTRSPRSPMTKYRRYHRLIELLLRLSHPYCLRGDASGPRTTEETAKVHAGALSKRPIGRPPNRDRRLTTSSSFAVTAPARRRMFEVRPCFRSVG